MTLTSGLQCGPLVDGKDVACGGVSFCCPPVKANTLLQTTHRSIHSTMGKIVGEIVVFQQKKENIKMTLANKNYE